MLVLPNLVICRHITQFEELQLLKEFEKRETTFTSRYRARKEEKREMEGKVHYSAHCYIGM